MGTVTKSSPESCLSPSRGTTSSLSSVVAVAVAVAAVAVAVAVVFGFVGCGGGCVGACGCGGGSFVRLFVCSCVHVFVCGGYRVLCRCVVASRCAVLRRRLCLRCCRRCVLCVVVSCCLFVSEVKCVDLLNKRTTAKAFANDVFIDQERRRPTTIGHHPEAAGLSLGSLAS